MGITYRLLLSLSASQKHQCMVDTKGIIQAADNALYAAKQAGRDTIKCFQPTTVKPQS